MYTRLVIGLLALGLGVLRVQVGNIDSDTGRLITDGLVLVGLVLTVWSLFSIARRADRRART